MKEINLEAPINSLGYGTIGRNLIPELKKLGVKVNLLPIGEVKTENAKEKSAIDWAIANAQFSDLSCPTVKIWHQHDMLSSIGTGNKYGFPIFELDRFSQKEIDSLLSVNVINCSYWAEEICKANGINSVGVVPLGYNPEVFYPSEYPSTDVIKILTIGKWEIRKGHFELPDYLIDFIESLRQSDFNAYKAFPYEKQREIELNVCCHNPFYTDMENKSWEDYYKYKLEKYCKVNFIPRLKTQEDVRDLISSNHISFLPSHSEGWGLEALETLACARQLVTTKYGGATEYYGKYNFTPELEPAIDGKWFFGQGSWLKFNYDVRADLLNQLDDAFKGCEKENKIGLEVAKQFTWAESAKKLCNIVGIKIND
mgnify:CR=1 FL=1